MLYEVITLRKSDVFNYIEDGRPYKFSQPVVQDPTAFRIPQLKFDKGKGKVVEMDRMRQMIADHMIYSKHTSPHVRRTRGGGGRREPVRPVRDRQGGEGTGGKRQGRALP